MCDRVASWFLTIYDRIRRTCGLFKQFATCDNAGIGKNVPAEDSSDEDWLRVINVNLNSVFYVWVKEQILRPPKDTPVERHLAGSVGALIPVDRGPRPKQSLQCQRR